MRYFNPASDARAFILDHYTGVGEVLAIPARPRLGRAEPPAAGQAGRLFLLDDAKNNDLIFVGSPSENLTLRDTPGTQEFVFRRLDTGRRRGDLAVLNVHPLPGEPQMFLESTRESTDHRGSCGCQPAPGWNITLDPDAGHTFGTQAAVEYVCCGKTLEKELQKLEVSKPADLKPFEALLRVKIAHGVPVVTELISVRKRGN